MLKERQMEATKRAVERIDDISHSNQVFSLKAKYKYKPFHILVKPTATHNSAIRSDEGLTLETWAFQIFHSGDSTNLSTRLIKPNFHVSLSHRRCTTVSLEFRYLFLQGLDFYNNQISNILSWFGQFALIEKDHLGDRSPEKDCCCSNHFLVNLL